MKILVAVDGSAFALAAVDFITSRRTLLGDEPDLELFNVQAPIPTRAARAVGRKALAAYYREEADKALHPARARLKRAGIFARSEYRVGHAAAEIAQRAENNETDLIVLGSHGHGALAGLVLGSVTNSVLARSKRPVLAVRGGSAGSAGRGLDDSLRVGIAVDGSKYSRIAMRYVLRHRTLFGAAPTFFLLNVVPDFSMAAMPDLAGVPIPAFTPEQVEALQARAFESVLAPMRKLLAVAKVRADEVRLAGNAGVEIAAAAKKRRLDLLVLGSHGRGAFRRAVLGSVATRVAAHSDVPLLLIRDA